MAEEFECMTVSMQQVMSLSGRSRASIYRLMAANRMPQPLPDGLRTKRWNRAAIDQWLQGTWVPNDQDNAA